MVQEKLVPTAKQPVDVVAPATSVATSCWLFGGKLARWFCESTPRVTPQDILQQLESKLNQPPTIFCCRSWFLQRSGSKFVVMPDCGLNP